MAAVTVNSKQENVNGAYFERYYNIDIANNNDTLQTDLKTVRAVDSNTPAEITKIAAANGLLTFSTGGAVAGALIRVTGEM